MRASSPPSCGSRVALPCICTLRGPRGRPSAVRPWLQGNPAGHAAGCRRRGRVDGWWQWVGQPIGGVHGGAEGAAGGGRRGRAAGRGSGGSPTPFGPIQGGLGGARCRSRVVTQAFLYLRHAPSCTPVAPQCKERQERTTGVFRHQPKERGVLWVQACPAEPKVPPGCAKSAPRVRQKCSQPSGFPDFV